MDDCDSRAGGEVDRPNALESVTLLEALCALLGEVRGFTIASRERHRFVALSVARALLRSAHDDPDDALFRREYPPMLRIRGRRAAAGRHR